MPIRYFDMFAGIGGFRSGLEAVGGFECVGYCEIDSYARKAYEALYDTRGEKFYGDATKIIPEQLPDFDLICGGFPCQSFSIAGARRGFEDMRGTLFFEIARIAAVKRPKYLYLENVPGLLNHDSGGTFKVILNTLDMIDVMQMEMSEFVLVKLPEQGTCFFKCGNERYLLRVIVPAFKAILFGLAGGR